MLMASSVRTVMGFAMTRPKFTSSAAVVEFTPSTLDSVVKQGDGSVTWLLLCFVRWSDRCLNLLPVFDVVAQR